MLKTPYLSIISRFLLLVIASLLFGLNHTAYAEGLSGLKESLNKGKTSIKVSDDKDAKLLKTKVNPRSNKVLNASKNMILIECLKIRKKFISIKTINWLKLR